MGFVARDARSGDFIGGCEVRIGKGGIGHLSYFTTLLHASRRDMALYAKVREPVVGLA